MDIVGAGLSGLIAAHIWPQAKIYEVSPSPLEQHKALLRFRSDVVAQVTGIEFKRVKVRKGIWAENSFQQPSIRLSNMYSRKCLGRIEPERSIWNIEPAERFIAPDDLYMQLVDNCGHRIQWDSDYSFVGSNEPCISTIPMPVIVRKMGMHIESEFHRAPITVQRFRLDGVDAYQTIYFPEGHHSVYRASITGDMLIVEHSGEADDHWFAEIEAAFGLPSFYSVAEPLGEVEQKYGKIVPISEAQRKKVVFALTHDYNIFSLGRFATWRNILLDDVVGDAAVIKRLMRHNSAYDLFKQEANK